MIKNMKLSDLTLNITDGTHSTIKDSPNGDCLLLSCKNVKNGKIIISENDRRINRDTLEKLKKRTKLEKDDILLTTVGTIGEMAMITDLDTNYDFQRSVGIIKPNSHLIFPRYLYYALLNEKAQIYNLTKGAVQQCLFLGDIKEINIPVQNKENQCKIMEILLSLDNKIDINNKINKNLRLQAA